MNIFTQKSMAKSAAYQRARLAALLNLVKSNQPGHLEKYFKLLTDWEFITEKKSTSELWNRCADCRL
jgi:hypothetical protein